MTAKKYGIIILILIILTFGIALILDYYFTNKQVDTYKPVKKNVHALNGAAYGGK